MPENVGEVQAVHQPPGTEGVHWSQVCVCVCCFFSTPVGGATPLSPAGCLLEFSLEKELRSQDPLGLAGLCSVFLYVSPTVLSVVPEARLARKLLQASKNLLSSQGGMVTDGLDTFFFFFCSYIVSHDFTA